MSIKTTVVSTSGYLNGSSGGTFEYTLYDEHLQQL